VAEGYRVAARQSARLGPVCLLDVFIAGAWALVAAAVLSAIPVRGPVACAVVELMVWGGALAVLVLLARWRARGCE